MSTRDAVIGAIICIGCVFGGYWAAGLMNDHRIRTTVHLVEKAR